MAKRSLSMLLALVAVFSLAAPAFAEEAPDGALEEVVMAEGPVVTEEVPEAAAPADGPMTVAETATSGNCGPKDGGEYTASVQWSFSGGTLTIFGTGPMAEFGGTGGGTVPPWGVFEESISQLVIEYGVTTIGGMAFQGCASLTSVSIPGSVVSIGDVAFYRCISLTSITVPDSVQTIGVNAFAGCENLIKVVLPNCIVKLPNGLLSNCSKLTDVTIPSSVTSIGAGAFQSCGSLVSITIPSSVTSIGEGAFSACLRLVNIVLGSNIASIGEQAFANCTCLTSIILPNGLGSIADGLFWGCEKLITVSIPDSVTSIGANAFYDCGSLTGLVLPSGLMVIGDSAFWECDALTTITIPSGVVSIGNNVFSGCDVLANVTIPEGVSTIGERAFSGCSSLTSVTLPNSVVSIGQYAFNSYNLASIIIPNAACSIFNGDVTFGPTDKVTIYGVRGSTAETYAFQYGYTFKTLEELNAAPVPTAVPTAPEPTAAPTAPEPTEVPTAPEPTAAPTPAPAGSGQLAAPTVTIAQVGDGIHVSWNKVSGAPRYMVYYKENGGSWKKIGTTTATAYTRKAANLKLGTTYQFTVRCCKNDKKTMLSGYVASNSLKYMLAAPTVTISKASNGIKVSWNKVEGAPRYMVYYKENGGSWKKIGTTAATTYTRKAANLKLGTTYQFTVRCCKNDKKTMLSGYVASNSLKYMLAAPKVTISKVSGGIKVSWNKVEGSPRYMVYYKENGGSWHKIGTTAATTYTRAASKLKNGATYQFTVRCCKNDKKTLLSPYTASNSLKYTK